jgi:hypothetical protein
LVVITPKHRAFAWLADQFVGVTEKTPNGGTMIEKFQRVVDGHAGGEAWCVGFVHYCAKQIDELFDRCFYMTTSSHHRLPLTEWTIGLWNGAHSSLRMTDPHVGHVVVWRSNADKNRGHAGIIVGCNATSIITVEGNTGSGDQREGDGVWSKSRANGNIPGFTRLGYLTPWL